ncbi:MAG: BPSL0067 family protein [Telluria sp.]
MPFVYREVDQLWHQPLAGSGTCVDIIKEYVPGLKGLSTTAWKAGVNVMEARSKVVKGTAIATFENGHYPGRDHDNHAAIVVKVMGSGIWVMDQWKGDKSRQFIERRLIRIPAPHKQRNADGTFMAPSDNALAFYVIER